MSGERFEMNWSASRAFAQGGRDALGVPLVVLMATFAGYAGLAREVGMTLPLSLYMTAFIWALPAMVVLIAQIASGATIFAAFLAVTLSSVRLTPMVVALLPELKGPRTRKATLFLMANFIAVTSWVIGMERARSIPRDARAAWFLGVEATLVGANLIVVAAVYLASAGLPPLANGALAFLMPTYFLASLWTSARDSSAHAALVAGLIVGPLVHAFAPQGDLLAAGLAGGLAAFVWRKARARR